MYILLKKSDVVVFGDLVFVLGLEGGEKIKKKKNKKIKKKK